MLFCMANEVNTSLPFGTWRYLSIFVLFAREKVSVFWVMFGICFQAQGIQWQTVELPGCQFTLGSFRQLTCYVQCSFLQWISQQWKVRPRIRWLCHLDLCGQGSLADRWLGKIQGISIEDRFAKERNWGVCWRLSKDIRGSLFTCQDAFYYYLLGPTFFYFFYILYISHIYNNIKYYHTPVLFYRVVFLFKFDIVFHQSSYSRKNMWLKIDKISFVFWTIS